MKLLLLTGTAPGPEGVGGIILHDLLRFLSPEQVLVAHVGEHGRSAPHSDAVVQIDFGYERRPRGRFGRAGKLIEWLVLSLRNRRGRAKALEVLVAKAKEVGVDRVWAVLDTPQTVELAACLASALDVPLLTTVWDDVYHNNFYFGLDRWTARRQNRLFDQAVRNSVSCGVIGDAMAAEYSRRYGVKSVVVRHGTAESMWAPLDRVQGSDVIRIGFAGSVTASSAFACLLAALDSAAWAIAGRPVVLRLLGSRFDIRSSVPRNIECLGWRSLGDGIDLLSDCTFNYLPQPFEASWEPFARWSFPSKLSVYLAAGAPVLVHAPNYGSLIPFIAEHGFGVACVTLGVAELLRTMESLAPESAAYIDSLEAVDKVRTTLFSRPHFREQFAALLGSDVNLLND